jgi:hypothetical protein
MDTPGTQSITANPIEENKDARQWGMFCHLSALAGYIIPFGNIIGPLVIWQIKKNEFSFVDDQGKESLNFQILMSIIMLIGIVVGLLTCGLGLLILPAIGIIGLIFCVMGSIKANNGILYRYPFNWRIVK